MSHAKPVYQIDSKWRIVRANEAFCRTFDASEVGLMGRDIRELLREDWRRDFRSYVARALVGVGECEATLPMIAPTGEVEWFKHSLKPIHEDGRLSGYRATMTPHIAQDAQARWWDQRLQAPKMVWDFEPQSLSKAS